MYLIQGYAGWAKLYNSWIKKFTLYVLIVANFAPTYLDIYQSLCG